MSAFLRRFEAIESRIASYSCPRGVPGRVHALRLRRCFQNDSRRRSAAVGEQLLALERDLRIELGHEAPGDKGQTNRALGRRENGEDSGGQRSPVSGQSTRAITRRQLKEQFKHNSDLQVLGDMFRPLRNEDGAVDGAMGEVEAELYAALRAGSPHAVFNMLSESAKQVGFSVSPVRTVLVSIPPATFSEVLRCLDPEHFVGRYQELHKNVSLRVAKQLGIKEAIDRENGYYIFCNRFLDQIKSILRARPPNRRPPGRDRYRGQHRVRH